eukprot:g6630.t1
MSIRMESLRSIGTVYFLWYQGNLLICLRWPVLAQVMESSVLLGALGSLSMLCSLSIVVIFCAFRRVRSASYKRVVFMSLCDVGLALQLVLRWWSEQPWTLAQDPCTLRAASQTFFVVATVSWYLMLALSVFTIFTQVARSRLAHRLERYQHCYVWPLGVLCACVPCLAEAPTAAGVELLVPIGLSLLASCFIMAQVALRAGPVTAADTRANFRCRMLFFVGMFCICWVWPALNISWDLVQGPAPNWLHVLTLCTMAANGIFNFTVWVGAPCAHKLISRYRWRRAMEHEGRKGALQDANAMPFLDADEYPASYFGSQAAEPLDLLQELYEDAEREQADAASPSLGPVDPKDTQFSSRAEELVSMEHAALCATTQHTEHFTGHLSGTSEMAGFEEQISHGSSEHEQTTLTLSVASS